ncbi:MAG: hypothetical protein DMG14_24680 [Acidobacteria bacterium]|nr:MAG: hypothetical protein DMG14_24680 [Acidobacteriota bacterium]
MMNLSKWAGVCVLTMFMVALTTGISFAQDVKVFEGTLMGVDPSAKVLVLKAGDTEMQFTYTEQTELVGPQKDGQPIAVRQGSRLKITYRESEKTNIATKIEVTEL